MIAQSHEIVMYTPNPKELVENAGRTCYRSQPKGDPEAFITKLIQMGHESVIEHASLTVRFQTDRGVTHELVRHRLASYSQESTRYCNYGGQDIQFILPVWFRCIKPGFYAFNHLGELPPGPEKTWLEACLMAEHYYHRLLQAGWSPQFARTVLPNSLAARIVVTANLREWRHIFRLRTSSAAHPQIQALVLNLLEDVKRDEHLAVFFQDL